MAAKRERAAQWLSTVERRRRCVSSGGEGASPVVVERQSRKKAFLRPSRILPFVVVVVPTMIGHDLDEILFHGVPSPSTLVNGSPNPMFAQRRKKDQLLLSWLRSSLSEGVLTSIANFQSSYMVWKALEQRFNSQSRARLLQLKNQFSTIRKGNLSISDYADKNLADSLAVAGSTMNDQDIIMQFLNGLGPDAIPWFRVLQRRSDLLSLEEVQALLLSHESRLENHNAVNEMAMKMQAKLTNGCTVLNLMQMVP
uniref:Retrotransposon gag domain-containing protein n=1 Tax=Cannabis sativa TaxID=3483 RepID=A0A803QAA2_CANSA